MRRQGSGFGFVVLLIVVAVVLFLASRAWRSTLPAAADALKHEPSTSKHEAAAEAPSPRTIDSDLKKVQRQADRRADEIQDTLKQAD